jgi:hypothetical protein
MTKHLVIISLCVASLTISMPANADYFVQGFTGGSNFGIFYGSSTGDVVGFRFTADETGFITQLGVLNDQADGVLDSAHLVGIWDSNQDLLGSVSVDSTGTLVNDFYYAPVDPIAITAGNVYTLGALYTATDNDSYLSSPTSMPLMHISNTNGVFPSAGDLGFVYPANDSTNLARLGPNAFFTTQVIPEPSSLALLGLVGLGLVLRRRKLR